MKPWIPPHPAPPPRGRSTSLQGGGARDTLTGYGNVDRGKDSLFINVVLTETRTCMGGGDVSKGENPCRVLCVSWTRMPDLPQEILAFPFCIPTPACTL